MWPELLDMGRENELRDIKVKGERGHYSSAHYANSPKAAGKQFMGPEESTVSTFLFGGGYLKLEDMERGPQTQQ